MVPVYPATKAAMTMLTVQYARALDGILPRGGSTGTFQDRYFTVPW
jgi:hypothetical protein